jgi:hypothetical protein
MNDDFNGDIWYWLFPLAVHPGVLAGARRGRRISIVAFTLQE